VRDRHPRGATPFPQKRPGQRFRTLAGHRDDLSLWPSPAGR